MSNRKSLKTYKSRRDFRKSPEPTGDDDEAPSFRKDRNPVFVIQEHDASTHHFDFRLEVDGVLKSWAVPKGPSTNPEDKRLAVQVEDHPLSYADFEGVIPEEQYGAGPVIVWDAGPYRNIKKDKDGKDVSMKAALKQGTVEVWLEGKKLRGGYALVHSKMRGKDENWLLIKMKDDAADTRRNPVNSQKQSVISGRTVKQVGKEEDNG